MRQPALYAWIGTGCLGLLVAVFALGIVLPFYLSGMQRYSALDIATRDTVEYLPPPWLPLGPPIFLAAALGPWLLPALVLLSAADLWRQRAAYAAVRRATSVVVLLVAAGLLLLLWTPLGAAMRTWVLS